MVINWITIKVDDYNKSKEFYRDFLGMKVEREFSPNESMSIAFFEGDNGMKIELIYDKNSKVEFPLNSRISIGVCPLDYDEVLQKSQEKNLISSGPIVLGGSMECFFIKDPNGVGIQVIKS
ncbi:VOC family protein [Clostridium paraputrificum]|uniref:VOC family protein n=1 Tax=Clostridium paraputrificum TaxID=29363 RepID=UPI003D34EDFA